MSDDMHTNCPSFRPNIRIESSRSDIPEENKRIRNRCHLLIEEYVHTTSYPVVSNTPTMVLTYVCLKTSTTIAPLHGLTSHGDILEKNQGVGNGYQIPVDQ